MHAVDVHQHLWTEGLLGALARRTEAPCASYARGTWTVEMAGEPAFAIDPAQHDPVRRAEAVAAAGLDRAIVGLSSPVGIEALPADQAQALLDAWHEDAFALPDGLDAWAGIALADPDPAALDAALDRGAAGLCVPAAALADPQSFTRLAPVLERLQDRMAPLFVHPGPTTGAAHPASEADWWAPCTRYVAEMHAAWHAFAAWGRPGLPRLRVVFALLAGLAPLHAERTTARGGPCDAEPDPLLFYEGSSYGPRALRSMAAHVGIGQLVHGTDQPVIDAPLGEPLGAEVHDLMRTDNAARLLGHAWVATA